MPVKKCNLGTFEGQIFLRPMA